MMKKLLFMLFWILCCGLLPTSVMAQAAPAEETPEVYGIGSVSKMFGTAAVMLLSDRGEIMLDTPVCSYIPEFEMADERYRQITVRMLLNHTSGLPGTTFLDGFLLGNPGTDYHTVLLDNLKTQHLKADPGAFGVYCNDGFTLAEILVERVSGMSFSRFIEQEFARPLGLTHTFMPQDLSAYQPVAPIYYEGRPLPAENLQCLAAGGIYSTAEDLCRFSRLFTENGCNILSEESIKSMAVPEYKNDTICVQDGESNFGYGLGWDSVDAFPFNRFGMTALTKGGDTQNYGTGLLVLPKQELSVSVTSSGGKSELCLILASEIALEILKEEGLITKEEEAAATQPAIDTGQPTVSIPENLKKFEGYYHSGEIWQLRFTDRDTAQLISLQNNTEMIQEYRYTEDGNFISTDGKYISYTGLAQTSGGISGITSFHIREEADRKIYLMGTTYSMNGGRAESVVTMPFAEKTEKNEISDETARAWERRNGRKYYLVNDAFNSFYYLKQPCIKIETLDSFSGYTAAAASCKSCRITDADNAVCELTLPVMAGRDLADLHFYQEGDTEYLQTDACQYVEESSLPQFTRQTGSIRATQNAQWFQIGSQAAGQEIRIRLPAQSAYYVYDDTDCCVASSLFSDEKDSVLLPAGGKLLLAGASGKFYEVTWLNSLKQD